MKIVLPPNSKEIGEGGGNWNLHATITVYVLHENIFIYPFVSLPMLQGFLSTQNKF